MAKKPATKAKPKPKPKPKTLEARAVIDAWLARDTNRDEWESVIDELCNFIDGQPGMVKALESFLDDTGNPHQ